MLTVQRTGELLHALTQSLTNLGSQIQYVICCVCMWLGDELTKICICDVHASFKWGWSNAQRSHLCYDYILLVNDKFMSRGCDVY